MTAGWVPRIERLHEEPPHWDAASSIESGVRGVVKDRNRASYTGEAMKRHDEVEARRLLEWGLKRVGLKMEETRVLKQSDPRKQGLCWLVKSRTVITDEWIQEALGLGDRSNVSRAMSAYRKEAGREVRK